ncbi:hypothetical protein H2248_000010 [Termitomyces sp. 'cryptogamus']|nr:hypothetical protein H2248_000010 [Termitomyces sp. 'cryptogamus']
MSIQWKTTLHRRHPRWTYPPRVPQDTAFGLLPRERVIDLSQHHVLGSESTCDIWDKPLSEHLSIQTRMVIGTRSQVWETWTWLHEHLPPLPHLNAVVFGLIVYPDMNKRRD